MPFTPSPAESPKTDLILPPLAVQPHSTQALVESSPAALEETAVRQTLVRYANAYKRMDVEATADVWPTVDRRALTRAFGALKSQGLTFDTCHVTLETVTAVAECRGKLEFVRKYGDPSTRVRPQQWLFRMRKQGGSWAIEQVTPAQGTESPDNHVR